VYIQYPAVLGVAFLHIPGRCAQILPWGSSMGKGVLQGGFVSGVCVCVCIVQVDATVVGGGNYLLKIASGQCKWAAEPDPKAEVDNSARLHGDRGGKEGRVQPSGHDRGSWGCITAAHHLCKRTVGVGAFQSVRGDCALRMGGFLESLNG